MQVMNKEAGKHFSECKFGCMHSGHDSHPSKNLSIQQVVKKRHEAKGTHEMKETIKTKQRIRTNEWFAVFFTQRSNHATGQQEDSLG